MTYNVKIRDMNEFGSWQPWDELSFSSFDTVEEAEEWIECSRMEWLKAHEADRCQYRIYDTESGEEITTIDFFGNEE